MPPNPLRVTDFYNQGRVEPSVFSRVDTDTRVQQRLQAFRDVVYLSPFEGGPYDTIEVFIEPTDLRASYDPEGLNGTGVQLSDLMRVPTFDARIPGAYREYVGRVGKPTASSVTLPDATDEDVLVLTSKDMGTYVNKIFVEIASGTLTGTQVVVAFSNYETVTLDNLGPAFEIAYHGNATSALMTITRTGEAAVRLQVVLVGQTDGTMGLDLDLTQADWDTIQGLTQYINAQSGYRSSINRYCDPLLPTAELDQDVDANLRVVDAFTIEYTGTGTACMLTITETTLSTLVTGGAPSETLTLSLTTAGTDTVGELVEAITAAGGYTCTLGANVDAGVLVAHALTPVTATDIATTPATVTAKPGLYSYVTQAELGAIVYAVNTRSTRVGAVRVPGAETPPANVAQTFLTGGTNPPATVNDWLHMLDVVKAEDLLGGMLFLNTASATLQAAALAWVMEQRKIYGTTFRAFFGAPPGLSKDTYRSLAMAMNSTYASMACQRTLAADGVTWQDPLYAAAMMCGLAAGVPQGLTTTNVAIRARDLIDKYSLAHREEMESNGLSVLKDVKGRGITTAFSLTTSLSASRIDRVLSESMARDYIDQNVRLVLYEFLGAWGTKDLIPQVKGRVTDVLAQLTQQGVITTGIDQHGAILPAYTPPSVGLKAGVLTVVWQAWIGGEISQIAVLGRIGYQVFEISFPVGA